MTFHGVCTQTSMLVLGTDGCLGKKDQTLPDRKDWQQLDRIHPAPGLLRPLGASGSIKKYLTIAHSCCSMRGALGALSSTDKFQTEQHKTLVTARFLGVLWATHPTAFPARGIFLPFEKQLTTIDLISTFAPKQGLSCAFCKYVIFGTLPVSFLFKNQYDTCKAALFLTSLPPALSEMLKIKNKVISYFKPKLKRVLIQWDKLQLSNFYQASWVRRLKERKKKL